MKQEIAYEPNQDEKIIIENRPTYSGTTRVALILMLVFYSLLTFA